MSGPSKLCRKFDISRSDTPRLHTKTVHRDHRGHFAEVWDRSLTLDCWNMQQVNHSFSMNGVTRGLHWQVNPYAIGKYVTCVNGVIQDVVVDLRMSSSTFGYWRAYYLRGRNDLFERDSLWVPHGFAHGFQVLSETADVVYMQTGLHVPEAERSLRFDDPVIGVDWAIDVEGSNFSISDKDRNAPLLSDLSDDDLFF